MRSARIDCEGTDPALRIETTAEGLTWSLRISPCPRSENLRLIEQLLGPREMETAISCGETILDLSAPFRGAMDDRRQ